MELIIVIAIIAILAAILVPIIGQEYKDTKENIVNIYNETNVKVIDEDTGQIIYEGSRTDMDNMLSDYELIDIKYERGVVVMKMKKKK